MAASTFGWSSFGLRFLFALILVGVSYNPEGWSYVHWALTEWSSFNALKALVGLLLLAAWTIYLRATLRSLGPIGLTLTIALFACLIWVLVDFQLLDVGSARAVTYAAMFVVVCVMAIGISWSHVRRRLSGQVDADDVDE